MTKQFTFIELMDGTAPANRAYKVLQPKASDAHLEKVYLLQTDNGNGLNARVIKHYHTDGSHKTNGGRGVVTLYGCYTAPSTRFELVEEHQYVRLSGVEALEHLNACYGNMVYVFKNGEHTAFGKYTDFVDIGVNDLDDFMHKTFYKRVEL